MFVMRACVCGSEDNKCPIRVRKAEFLKVATMELLANLFCMCTMQPCKYVCVCLCV